MVSARSATKKATSTIPIVSVVGQDPVATGLVASFARPNGNLRGFTILNKELIAKRLELLCDLLGATRGCEIEVRAAAAGVAPATSSWATQ